MIININSYPNNLRSNYMLRTKSPAECIFQYYKYKNIYNIYWFNNSVRYKMEIENISEIKRFAESLRWRLIGYFEAGKSQYESSKYFNIHQSSVSRIMKKFPESGNFT